MEDTFFTIYEKNKWLSAESRSGSGSTQFQTKYIQEQLIRFIKKYEIRRIFDCPCGDFNWFKNIVNEIPHYLGADIVKPIIDINSQKYPYQFIQFDITKDPIPDTDLIFCRDLLCHFSLDAICKTLENIKKSNATYLLITTNINRTFKSIKTGEWQPLSLLDMPFSFTRPIEIISENCSEFYPLYMDKSLALWKVADIPNFIPRKIFRSWHIKALPTDLQASVDLIAEQNPDFEQFVYDNQECEAFIETHFEKNIVDAYKQLIPQAYKVDLWRLCVLYIHGGIYLDISFQPVNGFRFMELLNREYFSTEVKLHPYLTEPYKGVSNGFIVTYPKNPRILECIKQLVDNVEKRFYGKGIYDITGAVLLGSFFSDEEKRGFALKRYINKPHNGYTLNGKYIMNRIASYDGDRKDGYHGVVDKQKYKTCWYNKTVYLS
jgi:hypothetical protein